MTMLSEMSETEGFSSLESSMVLLTLLEPLSSYENCVDTARCTFMGFASWGFLFTFTSGILDSFARFFGRRGDFCGLLFL